MGTGGLSARGAKNWSSHDCYHGAMNSVVFRPDISCYIDSSMLEESERRQRICSGSREEPSACVGVEEEEKGGHGPWNLREHVKVLSLEHHVPLQGSFPSRP